jgi:EAL domain-containing protein (putative c-di-GMP-specific phosphodiesterase class I)
MGCDFAQGFYFSRPVSPDEAGRLLLDSSDAEAAAAA